jgi:hypothetical protein
MTSFVDRLEDELIRAGYNRPRRYGRAAAAGAVAIACAAGVLSLALRTNAAPVAAPAKATCPAVARSQDEVDARLLKALGVLRAAPDRRQTPADASCAEAKVRTGPVYAGGARYAGPGPLGGKVYLVPVVHWSSGEGAMTPSARRWRELPGACMVTVGGPDYDAAGVCASVREIRVAGAFVASLVPREGPLADDLAKRGVPEKLRRGTFVRLIVPDGVASVEVTAGKRVGRAEVRGNTAVVHVAGGLAVKTRFKFFDAGGKRVRLP